MKTAISLPDTVFEQAEQFAHKVKRSRSQLYSAAIEEYLARHSSDSITEAMNTACELVGEQEVEFVSTAAKKVISKESW